MMNYLKRRFSSADIQGDLEDQREYDLKTGLTYNQNETIGSNNNKNPNSNAFSISNMPNVVTRTTTTKGPSPSAPSSPSKNVSFTDSVINAARNMMSNTATYTQTHTPFTRNMMQKEKTKILLIVDDEHTDWLKYFRHRKLVNDYEIRVEQAEFRDINLAAYSDSGTMVDINVTRNGSKVVRSFRPDFVLIRQHVKDINEDWKNIVIGLQYGNVPSINTLTAAYNFRDRAWVFSELIKINKKLGNDVFPLITQAYYPNHKEMLTSSTFPCIVKIGNAHQGLGKVKVQTPHEFQDMSSIVAITDCYSTTEDFIESKCDLHIQKIGNNYKAFMRKSISGNWKANIGSAMLEKVPVTDRYKLWIDEISKIFGGLDICAVEAVMGQDSKEYIIEANDSAFTLLGESQEEDRRLIAELVIEKLTILCIETSKENMPINSNANKNTVNPTASHQNHNDAPIQPINPLTQNTNPNQMPVTTGSNQSLSSVHLIKDNSALMAGRQLPSIPNRQPSPTRFQQAPTNPQQQSQHSTNPLEPSSKYHNTSLNDPQTKFHIPSTESQTKYQNPLPDTQTKYHNSITDPLQKYHIPATEPQPKTQLHNPVSNQTTSINNNFQQIQNTKANGTNSTNVASSAATVNKPARPQVAPQFNLQQQQQQQQQQQPQRNINPPQSFQKQNPNMANPNPTNPNIHNPYVSREHSQNSQSDDTDDTMKNLRKTFAGIFGEM